MRWPSACSRSAAASTRSIQPRPSRSGRPARAEPAPARPVLERHGGGKNARAGPRHSEPARAGASRGRGNSPAGAGPLPALRPGTVVGRGLAAALGLIGAPGEALDLDLFRGARRLCGHAAPDSGLEAVASAEHRCEASEREEPPAGAPPAAASRGSAGQRCAVPESVAGPHRAEGNSVWPRSSGWPGVIRAGRAAPCPGPALRRPDPSPGRRTCPPALPRGR